MSSEETKGVRGDSGDDPSKINRRAALKAFVGLGLASGLTDCTSVAEPAETPSPPLAELILIALRKNALQMRLSRGIGEPPATSSG